MQQRLTFSLIGISIFVMIYSCQYPVNSSELPDPERFIVIDAELTETYGKVRVTYTLTNVNSNGSYLFPSPPKATAYVLDSKGNRKDFKIDGSRDTTFKGVVGETYKLYVDVDGQNYESYAETMRPCPEIDSLSAIYVRESNRDPKDLIYDGFDVYAQFQDFAGQNNYYQWDWIHYQRRPSCGEIKEGDAYVRLPCNPYDCWDIAFNKSVITQSDKLLDGNQIAKRVLRVPYATPPNRYYLRIEQRAITPTVFEYLKSIEIQTQNVGSVFDIPAQTQFSANIYNVNDPKERILGIFNVFSSRKKVIYINMLQEIPGAEPKFVGDTRPFTATLAQAPCVEGLYITRFRPEGWID